MAAVLSGNDALRIPVIARPADDTSIEPRLDRIWETRKGLLGALSSVDHKTIGKRYLVTAFVFLLIGGLEAALMRAQLARPNQTLLSPPYNLIVHSSPLQDNASDYYHWHVEIMPKLTRVAGFEWGTGFYINPTGPEEAADVLRKVKL